MEKIILENFTSVYLPMENFMPIHWKTSRRYIHYTYIRFHFHLLRRYITISLPLALLAAAMLLGNATIIYLYLARGKVKRCTTRKSKSGIKRKTKADGAWHRKWRIPLSLYDSSHASHDTLRGFGPNTVSLPDFPGDRC